ncbi:hypothetical protein AB0P37_50215, partial [Streptomyces antimycoticus]
VHYFNQFPAQLLIGAPGSDFAQRNRTLFGSLRVEWLGPPGSGAGYAAEDALRNCAAVLRRLGWEALEYRGARRHRYLEVEPPPIGPSRS